MPLDVIRNDTLGRYEAAVPGGMAIAVYHREGEVLLLTHTEVPQAARGRGTASELIEAALADARRRGLRVRPLCSFVRRFMEEHPETQDLLA